jgi:alkylation response protein AidB-like acyl-CoA dehydrogenase
MDLRYSEADERFRNELRAWLAGAVPQMGDKPGPHDWPARREYDTRWQRMLLDAGYAGVNWPAEYGGRGATVTEQLVFHEECAAAGAPYVGVNFVGLLHAGPTLIAEATPEQKARHLPRILSGEDVWCQGFSEPEAGSDLAAMRTTAVRDGDDYVVTGQKIWTSFAQVADWCELLVRTDPDAPKHKGITWLACPMDAPGVEIRPLRTIIGSTEFSEVFFDEVRVPAANRVGDENDGWRVAMVTLGFERGTAFVSEIIECAQAVRELKVLAQRVTRRSGTAWDDIALRRDIGRLAAELDALWALVKRNVSESAATGGPPGVGASVLKLHFTELDQRLGELGLRVLGRAVLAREDVDGLPAGVLVDHALRSLSLTIAAGTSQIQRNIVAERILGLPREAGG